MLFLATVTKKITEIPGCIVSEQQWHSLKCLDKERVSWNPKKVQENPRGASQWHHTTHNASPSRAAHLRQIITDVELVKPLRGTRKCHSYPPEQESANKANYLLYQSKPGISINISTLTNYILVFINYYVSILCTRYTTFLCVLSTCNTLWIKIFIFIHTSVS